MFTDWWIPRAFTSGGFLLPVEPDKKSGLAVDHLQNVCRRQPKDKGVTQVLVVDRQKSHGGEIDRERDRRRSQNVLARDQRVGRRSDSLKAGDDAVPSLELVTDDEIIDHTIVIQLVLGLRLVPANGRKRLANGSVSDGLGIGEQTDSPVVI